MFSEILLIKARLDELEAKKMEQNLHTRFTSVAKRFSHGLSRFTKIAVGGSFFGGIGLGLINKILNPLEKIEEKIKDIMGREEDLSDISDKFGGTPAQLFQLEQLGKNAGLTTQELREMLKKFQERQELGRQEIANPLSERHRSTEVLGENLIKNENSIEAFTDFLNQLKTKTHTERIQAERAVFEERQTGSARRLIDTDFGEKLRVLGADKTGKIEDDLLRLKEVNELNRQQKTLIDTKSLLENAAQINPSVITAVNAREARQQARLTGQLKSVREYEQLQATADKVSILLEKMTELLGLVLVKADSFIMTGKKISESRTLRVGPTGQTRWE